MSQTNSPLNSNFKGSDKGQAPLSEHIAIYMYAMIVSNGKVLYIHCK